MSQTLGQPVIAENRVGAGGRIAAAYVAQAAPDGYTFELGTSSMHLVGPHVVKDIPYDALKDFTPITLAVHPMAGLVVPTSLGVNSVHEFIAYAKAHSGRMAYGSNGVGSSHHLAGEAIKIAAGIDMLHVPFKGSNEGVNAILSGQVQLIFSSPGNIGRFIDAGRLKILALLAPRRYPGRPSIPTLAEVLPGYEAVSDWFGFLGPAKLPRPILTRLHAEIVRGLNAPGSRAKFDSLTYLVVGNTPEEFAALMKREYEIYGKIVRAAKIPKQ